MFGLSLTEGIGLVKEWVKDGKPHFSRLMRLKTLLRIRWVAIFFQIMTMGFVIFGLGFPVPLRPCLALVALSAAFNLFLLFYYPRHQRIGPNGAMLIFAVDILLLSGLLYYTGGLENPFALLLIAPVGLAATSLFFRSVMLLNILTVITALFLVFYHQPLPWYPQQVLELPPLFIFGLLVAIIITMVFISLDSYRLAEEARQFSDALGMAELMLQRERYISALDGFAAAAVHELGSPLSTIRLIASDFVKELGQDARYKDDVELLLSQTSRCRDILSHLSSLSSEDINEGDKIGLTLLLEEATVPVRNFGISITLRQGICKEEEPRLRRNPALTYGLSNLVENAVDFAKSQVFLDYSWTKDEITVSVVDDGNGFAPDILAKIGEPYMSSRKEDKKKGKMAGGGMGLGLFITKTLLERLNIKLKFSNRPETNLGAEVKLTLPVSLKAESGIADFWHNGSGAP